MVKLSILTSFVPSFRPQDAYIGNLVSALGAMDAGITTLLDWSHIQGSPEHTDAVIKALQDSVMRAVFAYGFRLPLAKHKPPLKNIKRT
jgi:5-methylthioadenosine/S-adenosylhomocysteine deaminase